MGFIESYQRWKKILMNIKKDKKRISEIEQNLLFSLVREYSSLDNNTNDHKNILRKQEAKLFSQHGEDGLLMYLVSKIGVLSKTMLEIGIGDGSECNSRNFIENFKWNCWLIDGNKDNISKAEHHYNKNLNSDNISTYYSWVTKENIEKSIEDLKIPINIDILSIDIDGNDFWVWKSIQNINPRIVVIEYNASFGMERSVTVPYEPNFDRYKKHKSGYYHGASLLALTKLGKEKGYSLICCNSHGVNAFFIKDDYFEDTELKSQQVEYAFYPIKKRLQKMSLEDQFNLIDHLELVEI
jgi:hypothetical protein